MYHIIGFVLLFSFKSTWTELIFKPVATLLSSQCPHLPRSIVYGVSSMCVFLFSGITHEYYVYITFGNFTGDQITFFLCQGVAVVLEHALKRKYPQLYMPKPVGLLFTFVFNGITAGYFLRPYMGFFSRRYIFKYSLINLIVQWLISWIKLIKHWIFCNTKKVVTFNGHFHRSM